MRGVHVTRAWTSRFGRANLIGRAVDYLTFYLSAALALWRIARRGDVVIAKTDPPMLSVMAGPVAWVRGARRVNWLQDLFPEVAEQSGVRLPRIAYRALRFLRDRSLRGADMNVAIGKRMAERLEGLGVPGARRAVIQNWADGQLIQPVPRAGNRLRAEWGLGDAFVVGYSGNLGRAHDHATMIDAIGRLRDLGTVRWLFIGGGAGLEALRRDAAARGFDTVAFKPYQPRELLALGLSVADVHLVSLHPGLEGLIVPSKYYGIAAAGRPAIFIGDGDGEIARLIARTDGGLAVPAGDGAALALAIRELAAAPERGQRMGASSRRAFEREFDREIAVGRWEALLRQVAATPRG